MRSAKSTLVAVLTMGALSSSVPLVTPVNSSIERALPISDGCLSTAATLSGSTAISATSLAASTAESQASNGANLPSSTFCTQFVKGFNHEEANVSPASSNISSTKVVHPYLSKKAVVVTTSNVTSIPTATPNHKGPQAFRAQFWKKTALANSTESSLIALKADATIISSITTSSITSKPTGPAPFLAQFWKKSDEPAEVSSKNGTGMLSPHFWKKSNETTEASAISSTGTADSQFWKKSDDLSEGSANNATGAVDLQFQKKSDASADTVTNDCP